MKSIIETKMVLGIRHNDTTCDIVAKKIKNQKLSETWQRITDEPMPPNIYAFLLPKKQLNDIFDFTGGNSLHNQELAIREHGTIHGIIFAFVTCRYIEEKFSYVIFLRTITKKEVTDNLTIHDETERKLLKKVLKMAKEQFFDEDLAHELMHIYNDDLSGNFAGKATIKKEMSVGTD